MTTRLDDLKAACDAALAGGLHDGLRRAVDAALAAGVAPGQVLRVATRAAGGRTLTVLALEAYLARRPAAPESKG